MNDIKIPVDPIRELRHTMADALVACWIEIAKSHGFNAMQDQRNKLIEIATMGREP